ncbi:cytochrome P450/oxidoreductase [Burkholderia multivorans]|uniref:cytochrome P450/oxidoreductase n=1 Tax=Burkholderia multivorans TaxID=87883 RepID=UPI000D339181|nr:cytochrome P450/oxidoreductase [Burkholderia multivorans]MBR8021779.1 cytochrome P450/oxidoreductase [Burkholderia multivorans]MEB2512264.1 cytochrome P450/oxidoreductase [Burkholderia multivorans]MEB2523638.1 cytochrome P450/oxidoreductase [Burkholderia multivorans]MEB2575861.1 cytochrome P450/oxidoreductase [Burkholderia multivorans]MEB2591497.1 cytochrome P450/oxidoreductase [Burkholderia multivorans]
MSVTQRDASSSKCPFHPAPAAATAPNGCPVSAAAAAFDPFEDGYQQDPPEYVRWAREQEPVFYSPKLGYWVVTRYDDIKAIFRDNLTFSPSIALEKITPTGPEANAVLASYGFALNRTLVNEDEPAHMPRRRALLDPFTPDALKHHEPMVRRLAREYVDRFIDDGHADLVDQMLWEVPLTVALHFLGVPEEDMDTLREYSIAHTINTWGRPKPEEQVAVAHAVGKFWQFAGKVLDKMREDPSGPGWMQYGIRKQKELPDVITDSYLHSMMMAGIVAAHETTANATANAMKLLLQHPDAWRDICEDPSLIPNAVEECLRHNGSVAAWRRLATKDVTIGGVDIPAGAKLLIVTSSANHDEARFADADLFDIRRENASDQLTFGYGSHQCMGKNLARMEMQIFLDEFTRRLPHMKLAEQRFTYVPNTSFRGPEHLYVEWDPALNPERRDRSVLRPRAAVRIGEPSSHAVSRAVKVERVSICADRVAHVRLVSADGRPLPRWTAGSHIDVICGDTGITRQYSLCGDPDERDAYEIAVLHEAQSRGGSAWLHANLRAGDVLKIRGPRNHFRFVTDAGKAIFVAGGIGITPISAMAREAKARGIDYEIHYSGARRASMAMLDTLAALHGERLHVYVSEEGTRNDFHALFAQPADDTHIYACGPARMLDALEASCAHWPRDALRVEHFVSTKAALDPSKEQPFEVELKDSGITLTVAANQTVLDALQHANIDVQSDCREGLCGSCEVRVLAGRVDHRDSVLTRAERDAHDRMMTCCSRACGGERLVLEL